MINSNEEWQDNVERSINRTGLGVFWLRSFWLAVSIPALLALVLAIVIIYAGDTAIGFSPEGLSVLVSYLQLPLMVLGLALPGAWFVALNHRAEQTAQLLRQGHKQQLFSHYFVHIGQFVSHFNPELLKRLGIAPRLLHRLFYPNAPQGDFAFNEKLNRFLHLKLVEIVQAAGVVNLLSGNLNEDEQAVANNRIEFVLKQSVAFMYFITHLGKGSEPQCYEYFYLKDAMADYFDLLVAVTDFECLAERNFNLTPLAQLLDSQPFKYWSLRHDNFLHITGKETIDNKPFNHEFARFR